MAIDELSAAVNTHYATEPLVRTFEGVLRSWGMDRVDLSPADLEPIDQFHFGGAQATRGLADLADIGTGARVLDVGGGFGGPARMLASGRGARVTVLDLTEEYCQVGEMLTRRCGLSDDVSFRHGNGLAMPFGDGTFDVVWTQQSSMNIADKSRLYREIHRVLRPGGRLALYEVMAGDGGPLRFPVPWAADTSISFLSTPGEVGALLDEIGFRSLVWEDVTEQVVAPVGPRTSMPAEAPGLHLVLGDGFRERGRNGITNLEEGRATLIRAVLERR